MGDEEELNGGLSHNGLASISCLNLAEANGSPLSDTTVMGSPSVANRALSFSLVCCAEVELTR